MASADLTRRALAVGAQDATTGQFASTFATSTIDGSIDPAGALLTQFGAFVHTGTKHSMLTPDTVYVGDEITDASSNQYRIISRERIPWLDQFIGYKCGLEEKTLDTDSPVTSGTWSTTSKDPRERTKTWLDTYLSSAAFTLDNNSTAATYVTYWEGVNANIPIQKILSSIEGGLNYDFIIMIGVPDIEPAYTHWKQIYKFIETVHLKVCAIDKSGLTGTKLVHKVADNLWSEINAHGYAAGTLRQCRQSKIYFEQLAGGQRLWCQDVIVKYQRANELYTATYPTITWGSDYIYDGTHTSGGEEGTWTLTQGSGSTATQTSNTTNGLEINCTVYNEDSYTNNGTALSYSPAIYPYFKCRYKTTGSAKIKIILVDENNHEQTALSETSASTWTLSTVAIDFDDSDSLIGFKIYQCDGVGSVYVDFLQVYKGTYTFPNVIELTPPSATKDVIIPIPGMYGNVTQEMGAELVETEIVCDLDMEPSGLSWKRPQTTTKTDDNNIDCFTDINLGSSSWEWLNIGNPTYMFRVRLYRVEPNYNGDSSLVKLFFREFQPRALSWSVDDRLARSLRV